MLLNRRRLDPADDRGSAMAAVIGLLALTVIVTVAIAGASIASLTTTSATRASVQAQAAADGGIDAVYARLRTASMPCSTSITAAEAPFYSAKVFSRSTTTTAWSTTPSCPTASTVQVRIVTTGFADGASPSRPGAVRRGAEAVYAWTPSTSRIASTGSAVYVYDGTKFNSFDVIPSTTEIKGDVVMPTGDFTCSTDTFVDGSVSVAAGRIELSNTCRFTGSLRAATSVKLNNTNAIAGDVIAANGDGYIGGAARVNGSLFVNGNVELYGVIDGNVEATGSLTLHAGSRVGGDVTAGGTISRIEGTVGGTLTGAGTGQTTFVPDAVRVGGDLSVGGTLSTWNISNWNDQAGEIKRKGWVRGSVRERGTGLPRPMPKAAPTAPAWVDVGYVPSDWVSAGFRQTLTWPAGSCQIDSYNGTNPGSGAIYTFWQQVRNLEQPTLVDTRACDRVNFSSSAALNLRFKTDVAFVGHGFNFEAMTMDSADATERKVYFISIDGAPSTAGRQCTKPEWGISTNSTVTIGAKLAAMAYTPCLLSINNASKWRGQLYSGQMQVSANDGLTYVPIGIAGVDLGGGGATGGTGSSSGGSIGALVSRREVMAG